jgi:protocatechuate 3,4-dioxygenase beta subunit
VDISKGVIVSGKVLSASDCKPVSNAKVSHWQAGENGRYQDRLRAFLYTNAEGQFQFETEWPNLNPPHIHFIVDAEGFNTLETQWIGTRRQTEINFNIVLEEKTN